VVIICILLALIPGRVAKSVNQAIVDAHQEQQGACCLGDLARYQLGFDQNSLNQHICRPPELTMRDLSKNWVLLI
jgi:type II secretory pathway pseudopilin PulG